MAKKITGYIKLQVPAGAANPSPPIGRAWSARPRDHGVLQAVQRADQKMEKGSPIPVVITVYQDAPSRSRCAPRRCLFHQEGGEARKRIEGTRPRQGRFRDQGAGARDRRAEDEGLELRYDRSRDARVEGARSMGIEVGSNRMAQTAKRTAAIREGVDRESSIRSKRR